MWEIYTLKVMEITWQQYMKLIHKSNKTLCVNANEVGFAGKNKPNFFLNIQMSEDDLLENTIPIK